MPLRTLRRALPAAAVALALAGSADAAASSIVYVKHDAVWVTNPDGHHRHRLTPPTPGPRKPRPRGAPPPRRPPPPPPPPRPPPLRVTLAVRPRHGRRTRRRQPPVPLQPQGSPARAPGRDLARPRRRSGVR